MIVIPQGGFPLSKMYVYDWSFFFLSFKWGDTGGWGDGGNFFFFEKRGWSRHAHILYYFRSSTRAGRPTGWYKILHQYYYRDEWELYDLNTDPQELYDLATDPKHQDIFHIMQKTFSDWLLETHDPWRCMPHSVLSQGGMSPHGQ